MVIPLISNGIKPLIRTGSDTRDIGQVQFGCGGIFSKRIPDTGEPAASIGLGANDADISADVENVAVYSRPYQVLRRLFGGVSFTERTDANCNNL